LEENVAEIDTLKQAEAKKYWAFVSYAHEDEVWAAWLHKTLETYRVPHQLVGRASGEGEIPRRLFPVFRDRDELPGSFDLSAKIKEALQQSRYLIVICSPHAANSKWVNEEIQTFKLSGRKQRILSLIVDGEPNAGEGLHPSERECFPEALRFDFDPAVDRVPVRTEPIAADVRNGRDDRATASLRILAGMLNVGYDELRQRERQRARRRMVYLSGSVALAGLTIVIAYFLAADAGARIPGNAAIVNFIDRNDISIFRHAHRDYEIQEFAVKTRSRLLRRLQNDVDETLATLKAGDQPRKWMREKIGDKLRLSVWDSSQALYAILKGPETSPDDRKKLLPILDETFKTEALVPSYGWRPFREDYTRAEPTFWTLATLAVVLGRSEILDPTARPLYLQRFEVAQQMSMIFRPTDSGGWNLFPRQRVPSEHSTYASALALQALLETRAAKLPWQSSEKRRDELIVSTVSWLVRQFDASKAPPGWRPAPDDRTPTISDGLTLQIAGLLLRAEAEMQLALPEEIARAIQQLVESLADRDHSHPTTNNRFNRAFKNHEGRDFDVMPATEYLWYPWAIEASARCLTRGERLRASTVAQVRTRRALGHLVVNLGQTGELIKKAEDAEESYIAAETLIGLSALGIGPR
jgi:MTH538 TIR-like domain (DUF1863)